MYHITKINLVAEQTTSQQAEKRKSTDGAQGVQSQRKARECRKCHKPMKGHPRSHCPSDEQQN